jgi:hypothetical protein
MFRRFAPTRFFPQNAQTIESAQVEIVYRYENGRPYAGMDKKTRRDPVDPHRTMVFDVLSVGRNRGAVDQNSESAIQVRDESGQL